MSDVTSGYYTNDAFNKGGDTGGGGTFGSGAVGGAMGAISAIGSLWADYQNIKIGKEQNKLARESFEFNKDLSTKNFNLAREDHDRQVARSNNISAQWAGNWMADTADTHETVKDRRDAKHPADSGAKKKKKKKLNKIKPISDGGV